MVGREAGVGEQGAWLEVGGAELVEVLAIEAALLGPGVTHVLR